MGGFILIMGICLFVSVSVARVAVVLRKGKSRSRRYDEEVQDSIDKWRAENLWWRRKAGK